MICVFIIFCNCKKRLNINNEYVNLKFINELVNEFILC